MYRRYYSYNDMPTMVIPKQSEKAEENLQSKNEKLTVSDMDYKNEKKGIEADDIILIAVILLLLMNDCNDSLLLLALAFIFLNK